MTSPMSPAGWYPDPGGSGGQRYWNGSAWTEHCTPGPQPNPVSESTATEAPPIEAMPTHPAMAGPPPAADFGAMPYPMPPADGNHRKWMIGLSALVGVGVVAIAAFVVFATVANKEPTVIRIGSPSASTDPPAAGAGEDADTAGRPGAEVNDGDLTFEVTGFETADTVASPTNDYLTKNAEGEFVIVELTVTNNGTSAGSFIATLQKLKADGRTFDTDPAATFYAGDVFEHLGQGETLETVVVFDVPAGTDPESIELHATAVSPGAVVELP